MLARLGAKLRPEVAAAAQEALDADMRERGAGGVGGGGGGGEEEEEEEEEVPLGLMPDRLHPNAMGHRLMAKCLGNALRRLDEGTS